MLGELRQKIQHRQVDRMVEAEASVIPGSKEWYKIVHQTLFSGDRTLFASTFPGKIKCDCFGFSIA